MTSIEQRNFRITDDDQRPPLAPSDKNNDGVISRKPRTREISSRYMHSSSSLSTPVPTRHFPTPVVAPHSTLLSGKRAQSVERKLPSNGSLPSNTLIFSQDSNLNNLVVDSKSSAWGRSLDGLCPSMCSSRDSFQGDGCNLVDKREQHAGHPSMTLFTSKQSESSAFLSKAMTKRQDAVLRPKNGDEPDNNERASGNSHTKTIDHHHRLGRSVSKANALNRSLDLGGRTSKAAASLAQVLGVQSDSLNTDFQHSVGEGWSMMDRNNAVRRMPFDGREDSEGNGTVTKENFRLAEGDCLSHVSDNFRRLSGSLSVLESFSSTSDLNIDLDVRGSRIGGVPTSKGIVVSSRFLQTANSRNQRHQRWRSCTPEREGPSSTLRPSRTPQQGKGISTDLVKKALPNTSLGGSQSVPSSPTKIVTASSPSRGLISPSRIREQILSRTNTLRGHCVSSFSIRNPVVEVTKGNKRLNQVEDTHQLRLLHNRHLQWRFVNARRLAAVAVQTAKAKDLLYNIFAVNSDLRQCMALKSTELRQFHGDTNLCLLLKGQVPYLEEWASLEEVHSSCLSGAIEALQSRTTRVPVTGDIEVNLQSMKETLISAERLMQTMDLFMPSLLPKIERLNSFTSELAEIFLQEKALIDGCGDLLSTVAAIQAQESSYRTHLMQLKKANVDGKRASLEVHETV